MSTDDPEEQFNWLLFLSAISGDREVVIFPLPQLTALENLEISFNNELQTWCKTHDRWTLQNAKNEVTFRAVFSMPSCITVQSPPPHIALKFTLMWNVSSIIELSTLLHHFKLFG